MLPVKWFMIRMEKSQKNDTLTVTASRLSAPQDMLAIKESMMTPAGLCKKVIMEQTIIVTLEATRTDYSARAAARRTMTVGELISYLEQYDENSPVVFSNDNGYTYGRLTDECVGEVELEADEEE